MALCCSAWEEWIMRIVSAGIGFVLGASVLVGPEVSLAQEAHTFVLRQECRKTSDRGCTGSGQVCHNAPEGYFFAAGQTVSGQIVNRLSPRTHFCREATTGATGVPIAGGFMAPTSMCAQLHVESGGGFANINQVFFINCSYTATIYPIPRQ